MILKSALRAAVIRECLHFYFYLGKNSCVMKTIKVFLIPEAKFKMLMFYVELKRNKHIFICSYIEKFFTPVIFEKIKSNPALRRRLHGCILLLQI